MWKAGSIILRCVRWNAPSIVSSPSPIIGIRSRKCPSRQEKFFAFETRMWWLAAGPSIATTLWWKIFIVKIGP